MGKEGLSVVFKTFGEAVGLKRHVGLGFHCGMKYVLFVSCFLMQMAVF